MSALNEKKNEVAKKTAEIVKEGKDEVKSASNQLEDKASNLYERGKQNIDKFENAFSDYSGEVVKKVKDQPISSLLIAGGVGFILSLLLSK